MNDQKTLIEDLICFGSRYDLESCSLAAKVIAEQEKLIHKIQSENESGRATISQLKERVALLESSRAKEAQTADAMIGLEKAARNELERFKEDWLVLRSELCELDRENKNLRACLERVKPFVALLWESLDEILNYSGGADSALDDPYVLNRADEALSSASGPDLLAELNRLREASASKPSTADWAFCPRCGGSLDTGWECVKCGADWR